VDSLLHLLSFLLTVVGIYLGMQYYVAFWLLRYFPQLPASPAVVRCCVLLLALTLPVSMTLLRKCPGWASDAFVYAAYVWLGLVFIAFWCALAGDVVRVLVRSAQARPVIAYGATGLMILLSAYSAWNAARPVRVKSMRVGLPRLSGEGFTAVQVSDLHLGVTAGMGRLQEVVEKVNSLEPDLVVFTGDAMDPGFRQAEAAAELLSSMKARYGKLAVLGNHESYHGVDQARGFYGRCGIRLLRDEVAELPNGVQVAGLDDTRDLSVLSRLDKTKPSILLSHYPRAFDSAAEHGVGLTLSGHTHGGQMFPFHFFVRWANGYRYGLYTKGESQLYVTSGAGSWGPPMRLGTRSELPEFMLRPRESKP
jgi:predicted MPP superfamily phosphohydrolase